MQWVNPTPDKAEPKGLFNGFNQEKNENKEGRKYQAMHKNPFFKVWVNLIRIFWIVVKKPHS